MPGKSGKVWTGSEWVAFGPAGEPGKSAYEIAVDQGYSGTLEQWAAEMTGPIGPAGPAGPSGSAGPSGPAGAGVPTGGTTGQVLVKNSNADYDFSWVTLYTVGQGAPGGSGDFIVPDGSILGGQKSTYIDPLTGYTYNVHRFVYTGGSDILQVNQGVIGQLLIVGGGGGGGNNPGIDPGGAGGAGALWSGDYAFGQGVHTLTVGQGGGAQQNGFNSRFDDIICYGGGRGGNGGGSGGAGAAGGSGGGGASVNGGGGVATGGSLNGGVTSSTLLADGFRCSNGGGAGIGWGGAGGGAGPGSGGFAYAITGTSVTYGIGGGAAANTGSGGSQPNQAGANGVIVCRYRIA